MYLLIPAAGSGRRMDNEWLRQGKPQRNKLLLPLLGKPLLAWTLAAAKASQTVRWVGLIGQSSDWPDLKEIVSSVGMTKMVHFIPGGATRQESVYNGLRGLPSIAERVLIHDGARSLATPALFDRCTAELQHCSGLVAAIPVKDTIKVVDSTTQVIRSTPDRRQLWAAQTPQGFEVERLLQCHERGRREGWEVTDDAALFERCGLPVKIVEGEETNLKVTTPIDLAIAEFVLRQRMGD